MDTEGAMFVEGAQTQCNPSFKNNEERNNTLKQLHLLDYVVK
jgi:hypothetical protein